MINIAIIPARGGSKRIPKKNIRDFFGKPIIYYTIKAAIDSLLFDEVIVSTDDIEIKEIALKFGAKVPFMRSAKNSTDFANTADTLLEVLNEYESNGFTFDNICCLYPTAPFITPEKLKLSYNIFLNGNYDSFFPVQRYSYPIQRALKIENNRTSMIHPENMNKRSQDLEPAFHDCGQFYWLKNSSFKLQKRIFMDYSGSVEYTDTEVQDIDNEMDWKIAEIKFGLLSSNQM